MREYLLFGLLLALGGLRHERGETVRGGAEAPHGVGANKSDGGTRPMAARAPGLALRGAAARADVARDLHQARGRRGRNSGLHLGGRSVGWRPWHGRRARQKIAAPGPALFRRPVERGRRAGDGGVLVRASPQAGAALRLLSPLAVQTPDRSGGHRWRSVVGARLRLWPVRRLARAHGE